jgi:hypothetical protein
MQYQRMIALMRDEGLPLPSPEEEALILDYLKKHAHKAG